MVVAQQVPQSPVGAIAVVTISKLKRWSINYYIDTAQPPSGPRGICTAPVAGWGSTTPNTRLAPRCGCWPATPTRSARWWGLTDAQRAGGEADAAVVARWLDDGIAPAVRTGAHSVRAGCTGSI